MTEYTLIELRQDAQNMHGEIRKEVAQAGERLICIDMSKTTIQLGDQPTLVVRYQVDAHGKHEYRTHSMLI